MNVKNNFCENSDYIFITKMELSCRIGTTSEERAFPQLIWLSAKLYLPLQKAGQHDQLQDTIDYAEVISQLKMKVEATEFQLVETVAETAAELILKKQTILHAEVKVEKKVFAGIASVGAHIFRSQR